MQLTATGLKTINAAFVEDMAIEAELLSVLDDGERRQLAALLARLLSNIEQRD